MIPRARHLLTPFAMAKQQKSRAQLLRVNGKTIRVSPRSDIDAACIKLILEHVDQQIERHGEDYYQPDDFSWVRNQALAAALKAKGHIH